MYIGKVNIVEVNTYNLVSTVDIIRKMLILNMLVGKNINFKTIHSTAWEFKHKYTYIWVSICLERFGRYSHTHVSMNNNYKCNVFILNFQHQEYKKI